MQKLFTRLAAIGGSLFIIGLSPSFALAHDDHHHDAYYYGGPFFGSMVTNQVLANMQMAYDEELRPPPPIQYGNHADHRTLIERREHPYQQTTSSQLAELDRLAASGAITQKQYRDRRLGIIDGL